VFTGGVSLFEAKRNLHQNIHPFPSGVDVYHFRKARGVKGDYREQEGMARPRLGFAGVIDERMNLDLIGEVARRRPEWQLVMIGPTAKIAPESLPRAANIHWLGMRDYKDLPHYFAGWDVAMMPFALNDSTRFISPTKTPEFLVAGLPVVSTPIRDVVRPYGELGLVRIADTTEQFIDAVDCALAVGMSMKWRERADEYLKTLSWDSVWNGMNRKLMASLRPEKTMTAGSAPLASSEPGVARV
jgi:UDP-galactopyranose mutase